MFAFPKSRNARLATLLALVAAPLTSAQCGLAIGAARSQPPGRPVHPVDLANLPTNCDGSNELSVTLTNGKSKSFMKTAATSNAHFHGESPDDGSSFEYIRISNGKIIGSLVDSSDNTVSQFRLDALGDSVVITTPTSEFPPEADPPHDARRLMKDSRVPSFKLRGKTPIQSIKQNSGSKRRLYDDSGSNIDVMVVWTAKSECANSLLNAGCTLTSTTEANMRSLIDLAITETNTAYLLSGINTQLLLVHAYRDPSYVEAGIDAFGEALSHLRGMSDGNMDDVHAKREYYGADVVAMIIDDPQYCGIGYLGPQIDKMFSVTKWTCATGYYSFGHEIGHNFGAHHDRGTLSSCTSTDYNFGWRDPAGGYRSILAYNCKTDQCDSNARSSCTRVQRFSNPDPDSWNGSPIGNTMNDNARKMNDGLVEVAGYFTHLDCTLDTDCVPANLCYGEGTCEDGTCSYNSPVACTTSVCGEPEACNANTGLCEQVGSGEDGICSLENGETCLACPGDCTAPYGGNDCGNGVCEQFEDCNNCPSDCNGITSGKPNNRFCCAGGQGGCVDTRCTEDGFACTTNDANPGTSCCGDDVCEGDESFQSCPHDCPAPVPTSAPSPPPFAPTPCPVCSHTGETCCGTCVSGGKKENRGCFP